MFESEMKRVTSFQICVPQFFKLVKVNRLVALPPRRDVYNVKAYIDYVCYNVKAPATNVVHVLRFICLVSDTLID